METFTFAASSDLDFPVSVKMSVASHMHPIPVTHSTQQHTRWLPETDTIFDLTEAS